MQSSTHTVKRLLSCVCFQCDSTDQRPSHYNKWNVTRWCQWHDPPRLKGIRCHAGSDVTSTAEHFHTDINHWRLQSRHHTLDHFSSTDGNWMWSKVKPYTELLAHSCCLSYCAVSDGAENKPVRGNPAFSTAHLGGPPGRCTLSGDESVFDLWRCVDV